MKFDLFKAQIIPKSNVRDASKLSLESLVTVKQKPILPSYDLVYQPKTSNWKINEKFIIGQGETIGWTAAIQENYVFLLRTDDSQIAELSPRFLKGEGCGEVFKSEYLTYIVGQSGIDLETITGFYLEEVEGNVEGVVSYVLTTEPFEKEIVVLPETKAEETLPEIDETVLSQIFVSATQTNHLVEEEIF